MDEASKTIQSIKDMGKLEEWIKGDVLDVGCGPWPIQVDGCRVTGFDKPDGDAQTLDSVGDAMFDTVFSSHCLEHLNHPAEAIRNWSRVLKSGGFLVVAVPDWTLYEKRRWPSRFNPDHRMSFSMTRCGELPWGHVQYDRGDMVKMGAWAGLDLVHSETQDKGIDFGRMKQEDYDPTMHGAMAQNLFVYQKR